MDEYLLKIAVKNAVREVLNADDKKEIFIRLSSKKENESPSEKKKAFYSFPEKSGYEIVYKSYGKEGRGFYYLEK